MADVDDGNGLITRVACAAQSERPRRSHWRAAVGRRRGAAV